MSGGTQLAVADDDDLDQVPLEATPITLIWTDMANLSVDELLLDYYDLRVKPSWLRIVCYPQYLPLATLSLTLFATDVNHHMKGPREETATSDFSTSWVKYCLTLTPRIPSWTATVTSSILTGT